VDDFVRSCEVKFLKSYEVSDYMALIRSFLDEKISMSEFERHYLQMFKEDLTIRPEGEYAELNGLFREVDAFCDNPSVCWFSVKWRPGGLVSEYTAISRGQFGWTPSHVVAGESLTGEVTTRFETKSG
jgi:hypothetical protein